MRQKRYYVYIMGNRTNSVLYTGVTNNLENRIFEHKSGVNKGFTKKYNVHKLLYCETFCDVNEAISFEKFIKGKRRSWKIDLVATKNPGWIDLSDNL